MLEQQTSFTQPVNDSIRRNRRRHYLLEEKIIIPKGTKISLFNFAFTKNYYIMIYFAFKTYNGELNYCANNHSV